MYLLWSVSQLCAASYTLQIWAGFATRVHVSTHHLDDNHPVIHFGVQKLNFTDRLIKRVHVPGRL